MIEPISCSGTSRRDPHGLGQAERFRKFLRRLGLIPSSSLTEPKRVPAPPVTSAPASFQPSGTTGNSEYPCFFSLIIVALVQRYSHPKTVEKLEASEQRVSEPRTHCWSSLDLVDKGCFLLISRQV